MSRLASMLINTHMWQGESMETRAHFAGRNLKEANRAAQSWLPSALRTAPVTQQDSHQPLSTSPGTSGGSSVFTESCSCFIWYMSEWGRVCLIFVAIHQTPFLEHKSTKYFTTEKSYSYFLKDEVIIAALLWPQNIVLLFHSEGNPRSR